MCGIAGIYAYQQFNSVNDSELIAIRDYMLTRGPDAAGLWLNRNKTVGLAHRRLTIIDLSSQANQPMSFENGRYHICYNGEIYNYAQLREQLRKLGVHFQTHSDTEVILALYAQYGPNMLNKLRGMFAIAIWDEQTQTLFLARDPFGIKPLYYANVKGQLFFASLVKALLRSTQISNAIQPAGMVSFYTWGHVADPHTCYRDIMALPAGHYLIVKNKHVSKPHCFLDLREVIIHAEQQAIELNEKQLTEQLQQAFDNTVSHHLIADVPVGVFLSAGLDSASIATVASKQQKNPLRTLTLSFKDYVNTEWDEAILAEQMAAQLHSQHTTHQMSPSEASQYAHVFLNAMDQPTIDGLNTFFVAKLAADAKLKVVLSGLGGDELLGGYSHFNWLTKLNRYTRPISKIPGIASAFRALSYPALKARGITTKYAELLKHSRSIAELYFLRRALNVPSALHHYLDLDIIKQGWEELNLFERLHRSIEGITHPKYQITALEMQWYMRHQLLRDSDWASMAHSLELRVPFVDIELLKAVLAIRNTQVLSKKQIIERAVPTLPPPFFSRKKTGFFVPIRQWILRENTQVSYSIQDWSHYIMKQNFPKENVTT